MQTLKSRFFVLLIFFFVSTAPAISQGAQINLSVAASMTDAIKELAAVYSQEQPGITIRPNFGSSGALAKQIAQGAPADLYISANAKWMDYLVQEGMVSGEKVRLFAANSLVFVGPPATAISSLAALPTLTRIAIGSPQSVPAGQYAEEAMRAVGVYAELLQKNKLVMAKDVRQALLYAERGEVDGAFVYKTDALLAQQAVILFTVPGTLHKRIDYPVGLTLVGEKNVDAQAFYTFLSKPVALAILAKFGFSAPSAIDGGVN